LSQNCQTFSVGFSSGEYGGSGRRLMLPGTCNLPPGLCQAAPSTISTACAPGAICVAISARCGSWHACWRAPAPTPRRCRARDRSRRRYRPSYSADRAAHVAGCRVQPRRRSGCLAGRSWLRRATIVRAACPAHRPGWRPRPVRQARSGPWRTQLASCAFSSSVSLAGVPPPCGRSDRPVRPWSL
jgi:hypothetical protein